jgi:hypothetical protein
MSPSNPSDPSPAASPAPCPRAAETPSAARPRRPRVPPLADHELVDPRLVADALHDGPVPQTAPRRVGPGVQRHAHPCRPRPPPPGPAAGRAAPCARRAARDVQHADVVLACVLRRLRGMTAASAGCSTEGVQRREVVRRHFGVGLREVQRRGLREVHGALEGGVDCVEDEGVEGRVGLGCPCPGGCRLGSAFLLSCVSLVDMVRQEAEGGLLAGPVARLVQLRHVKDVGRDLGLAVLLHERVEAVLAPPDGDDEDAWRGGRISTVF